MKDSSKCGGHSGVIAVTASVVMLELKETS